MITYNYPIYSYVKEKVQNIDCAQYSPISILLNLSILLFFVITPSLSYSAEHPSEKVTLQLKWKHAFQFAGFYAALEKGFYDKAGLRDKCCRRVRGQTV